MGKKRFKMCFELRVSSWNQLNSHLKPPCILFSFCTFMWCLRSFKKNYICTLTPSVSLQTFAIPGSIFLSILSGYLYPFPLALFLVCLVSNNDIKCIISTLVDNWISSFPILGPVNWMKQNFYRAVLFGSIWYIQYAICSIYFVKSWILYLWDTWQNSFIQCMLSGSQKQPLVFQSMCKDDKCSCHYVSFFFFCQCSGLGASFCYMLSYLVGRPMVYKYLTEKAQKWSQQVSKWEYWDTVCLWAFIDKTLVL